jgi:multicomponent Na+:H+ antiporter subunit F
MTDAAFPLAGTLLALVLVVPLACAGYRMVRGPGYADRFIALDMLTGVAVGFVAAVAVGTGEPAFLDVGLGLALVAFVASCAFARFLERKAR